MLEFASPDVLWGVPLVLALPLVAWLRGRNQLVVPLSELRGGWSVRQLLAGTPRLLEMAGLLLCLIALARPQTSQVHREQTVPGLDIVLALDASASMQAPLRGGSTRMEEAKAVLQAFIEARPHDRIGLVGFGDQASTLMPPTVDHDRLHRAIAPIQAEDFGRNTNLAHAIALSGRRLRQTDRPGGVILLLTDGNQTADHPYTPVRAAQMVGQLGMRLHTVSVGKRFGAEWVMAPLNHAKLEAMATAGGGRHFHADTLQELASVYATLDELEPTTAKLRTWVAHTDHYRYALLPGLLLLGSSLLLGQTVFRRGP